MSNLKLSELWNRGDLGLRRKFERTIHRIVGYEKVRNFNIINIRYMDAPRFPTYLSVLHGLLFPIKSARSFIFYKCTPEGLYLVEEMKRMRSKEKAKS